MGGSQSTLPECPRDHQPAGRGVPTTAWTTPTPASSRGTHKTRFAPISSRCQPAHQTRVTFGLVLLCRKKASRRYRQATASHATAPWPAVAGSFGLPRERRIVSPLSGSTPYPCQKLTNTSHERPTVASKAAEKLASLKGTAFRPSITAVQ